MRKLTLGLLAAAALAPGAALAHHSFAMFDAQKEMILTGTVSAFQWTNPHTWVEIDVPDGKGGMKHWSIEGGSVVGLSRQGWKRTTLKPGDKISMVVHPLRNGDPGGSLMGVVTAEGKALGEPLTPPPKKPGPPGAPPGAGGPPGPPRT